MPRRLLPLAERVGRAALRARGHQSRFVETEVGRVHAFDVRGQGDAPPIVVVHGIGSGGVSFAPLSTRLARGARRVITLDLPGHGASDGHEARLTPDALYASVEATLAALVDEPVVIFGNSLGGAIALRWAARNPSKTRGLVVASPAGARMNDREWRELVGAFDLSSSKDARRLLARLYHRPRWFLPALAPGVRATFEKPAIRSLLGAGTPEQSLTADELGSIRAPTLLLWGKSERLLPPSGLAWFRDHLPPHAEVEEPEGHGHCAHLDDPTGLADRILRFARET